jgi:cytochrome c oxidase cbb3-type subunit III
MNTQRMLLTAAITLTLVSACRRESRDFDIGVEIDSAGESAVLRRDYEENAQSLSEGKRLFAAFNCSGCHANGGGGMGPPLLDAPWRYGNALPQVFESIMKGRPNGMPGFHGRIVPQQAWQIAAYVRSLSGQLSPATATSRSDHMKSNPPENSVDPVPPAKEPVLPGKQP